MAGTRTLLLVALVAALLVAGCAGGQSADSEVGGVDGADGVAATGAPEATAAPDAAPGDDSAPPEKDGAVADREAALENRAQPALIRTGTVVLEVDDFDRRRSALVDSVRSRGGYVADSGVTRHREGNLTWQTGYVVLRVPSGEFGGLLADARAEGTVLSEETRTRDVSDQLVDLEARLDNLRARRDRLREFYDRANSTRELLAIERELSTVQGEIERLDARKRALEDRVAYSTLRVEVREPSPTPTPTPTPTPEPRYHEQSLVGAFVASVDQLVVLGRAALVTVAYALPYLLALAIPLVLAGGVVWFRIRR